MVINATFNNISAISWLSVLLVDETGVPGENSRPAASHWSTFITQCCIEYTSPWAEFELTILDGLDKINVEYQICLNINW